LIKKLILVLLFTLLGLLIYYFPIVKYGVEQGVGQLKIINNTVPIKTLMEDEKFPDSIKTQFRFIEEIRKFAEDSLSLNQTENYTTFYDQKGKPILWVVTASPEFEIKAYEWDFPILGSFPYKGFFDLEKAKVEEQKMKDLGYDTEIDEVNAWSTLGWLKDPILSSMLNRSKIRLADLIIHESMHATLYVKDDAKFNENLASFVGKAGAKMFIENKYGKNAKELKETERIRERGKIYKKYMNQAIKDLNIKYKTLTENQSITEKRELKTKWLNELKYGLLDTEYYNDKDAGKRRLDQFEINNAYLSGFSTYAVKQNDLQRQLEEEFNGNLRLMIEEFKKKYRSL